MAKFDLRKKQILKGFFEKYNKLDYIPGDISKELLTKIIDYLGDNNLQDLESISDLILQSEISNFACYEGHEDVINILLKFMPKEAIYRMITFNSCSPFLNAVIGGHIKIMEKLSELYTQEDKENVYNRLGPIFSSEIITVNKDVIQKLIELAPSYESLNNMIHFFVRKNVFEKMFEKGDIELASMIALATETPLTLADRLSHVDINKVNPSILPKFQLYLDNPELLIDLGRKRNALIQSGLTHTQIDQAISVAKNLSSFAKTSKDPRSELANIRAQAGNDNIEISKYVADHILNYISYDNGNNADLTDAQRKAIYDLIKFDQNNFVKRSSKDARQTALKSSPKANIKDETNNNQESNWFMSGIYRNIGKAYTTFGEYVVNPIINLALNGIKDELVENKESSIQNISSRIIYKAKGQYSFLDRLNNQIQNNEYTNSR